MRDRLKQATSLELSLISGAVITGFIHLYVGISQSFHTLTLAGAGFLAGAGIFLLDRYRNAVVLASIPYTGVQFVFYYQTYGLSFGPLALIDKVVQAVFIIAGIYFLKDNFRSSQSLKKFLVQ